MEINIGKAHSAWFMISEKNRTNSSFLLRIWILPIFYLFKFWLLTEPISVWFLLFSTFSSEFLKSIFLYNFVKTTWLFGKASLIALNVLSNSSKAFCPAFFIPSSAITSYISSVNSSNSWKADESFISLLTALYSGVFIKVSQYSLSSSSWGSSTSSAEVF